MLKAGTGMRRPAAVFVCALAALFPSLLAQTAPAPPSYSDDHASVLIPYARALDFTHLDRPPQVRMQINGGPVHAFTVDTGSVGIIVSADEVPNIAPDAPPGQIVYSSSGVKLLGVWTRATVRFPDARGGEAVAEVPVLAVRSEECTDSGVNRAICHANAHPHPYMMGVGFGRGMGPGHPERNPFLNLQAMQAGAMRRGYVIERQGIMLGLTAKEVGSGFVWQKLTGRSAPAAEAAGKDWETPPGSFRVGNQQAPEGTALIDTGLTNMMLAAPGQHAGEDVPDGTPVTIELLGGQLRYSFRVGDESNPQTPRRVTWVLPKHGVYVNTGLRALAAYDLLFDADGGWLALRPAR